MQVVLRFLSPSTLLGNQFVSKPGSFYEEGSDFYRVAGKAGGYPCLCFCLCAEFSLKSVAVYPSLLVLVPPQSQQRYFMLHFLRSAHETNWKNNTNLVLLNYSSGLKSGRFDVCRSCSRHNCIYVNPTANTPLFASLSITRKLRKGESCLQCYQFQCG